MINIPVMLSVVNNCIALQCIYINPDRILNYRFGTYFLLVGLLGWFVSILISSAVAVGVFFFMPQYS